MSEFTPKSVQFKADNVTVDIEKPFENPLEKLKKSLHYERATFDESGKVITVGSNVYSNCEKLDIRGGQSEKYIGIDSKGNKVMIKIRKESYDQDISSLSPTGKRNFGEDEQTVTLFLDEAVLALMSDCETGKESRPNLLAYGKLAEGRSLIVEELVSGFEIIDFVYPLRDTVLPGGSRVDDLDFLFTKLKANKEGKKPDEVWQAKYGDKPKSLLIPDMNIESEERNRLEKQIDCVRTIILSMFRDGLQTITAMLETNVFNRDIKIADYIIDVKTLDGGQSPQELEKSWHGVFVDWGLGEVRTDKARRPEAARKDLFLFLMRQILDGGRRGVFSCFFNQSPSFPKKERAERISTDTTRAYAVKMLAMMEEVREPLESLYNLIDRESNNPQSDFIQQGENIFKRINQVAENIGLKMRFEFPL